MGFSIAFFQLTNLQTGINLYRHYDGDTVANAQLLNNLFQNVNEYDMLLGLNVCRTPIRVHASGDLSDRFDHRDRFSDTCEVE